MRPTVVTAALLLLLTVPTSSVRPLPPPTRVARHVPSPALGRRRALAGAAALGAALATTQPANAAYAPSLASLSSSAPLKDISVDEWLKLSPKKRLQRGAVISRDRARELGREFDKQTYNVERDAIEGLIKEVETEIKALVMMVFGKGKNTGSGASEKIRDVLKLLDADGDGEITRQEFMDRCKNAQSLMKPAFMLQTKLSQELMGPAYWQTASTRPASSSSPTTFSTLARTTRTWPRRTGLSAAELTRRTPASRCPAGFGRTRRAA